MTTEYLVTGIILGLSAGLAPGPLLTLVITETFQHDIKAGIKVAFAPVITDLPLILLTVLVLSKLADSNQILGMISLAGSVFVLWLGYSSLRIRGVALQTGLAGSQSLMKGILANVLSPYPYLFWLSVGAPLMTQAWTLDARFAVVFITSFYGVLVGSKILLAIAVGHSKSALMGKPYIYIMRALGVLLIALAGVLLHDGLVLLGVMPP